MPQKTKVIRVGIDIRDLRVAKTGQKTVTDELRKEFANDTSPEFNFIFLDSKFPVYTGKTKWRIMLEHIRYQYWKQMVLPFKAWMNNCDIVFCGDYFVPYIKLGFKTVEIFHDAFFFENPEHYNRQWLMLFHKIAMPAARRCAMIMTVTEYSKKRIHHLAGIPYEKMVTIYPGPKTIPSVNENSTIPASIGFIPAKKYILHVGVMEKRKNIPALIKAFALLLKEGYEDLYLVLVGQGNGKIFSDDSAQIKQTIANCGLQRKVICTGYLVDEEVEVIYRHALMYVFPSINEGFGIPILEAFRAKIPVLVANNTCLPEVGGDAVLTFDPFKVEDICHKMKMILSDPEMARLLVDKGQQRLQHFYWQKAAAQLKDVFRTVRKG